MRIYLVKAAVMTVVTVLLMGAASAASAQIVSSASVEGPYYNPHSKSYFELRRFRGGQSPWANAKKAADQLTYKDAQGRLAIVDDIETHEFLLRFHLKTDTWIGLRLDCSSRELIWVDGSKLAADGFNAWNPIQWYRNPNIRCKNTGMRFMGVYYRSRQDFHWQAAGQNKVFHTFLVEYPTGQP